MPTSYAHPYTRIRPERRHAFDTIDDATMEKAISFLEKYLGPGEISELKEILMAEQDQGNDDSPGAERETAGERSEADDRRRKAADAPVPFRGMPRTGGKIVGASDSKETGFAARFPEIARIQIL